MMESKILPDGTDVHNIRKLSTRILCQFLCWHAEDDDLRRVAEDEINLRAMGARDYVKNNARYFVEEVKPRIVNTEFSDCLESRDESFW